MKRSEMTLNGVLNSHLHVYAFLPEKPKGILHILHGMGEHAERYEDFANYLTKQGIAVYAHDHRAHGKSLKKDQAVGILDSSDTFENIIQDVEVVRIAIEKAHKDLPYYLLGHSMGSIILRRYLQVYPKAPVEKAIVMGTLPRYSKPYMKIMRILAGFLGLFKSNHKRHEGLAKLLNDGLIKQIKNPQTPFDWLSYDQAIVVKYVQDPLCGYAYNKRFYKAFFKTVETVNKKHQMKQSKVVETLFIAGVDDPINHHMKAIHALVLAYHKIQSDYPIQVEGIDQARHEVLNELNKLITYEKIANFLTHTNN